MSFQERNCQGILDSSKEDKTQIEMQFECDSVWLNQSKLIELFQSSKANINLIQLSRNP